MIETILYAIVFFLITLLLQYVLSKQKNKGKFSFWEGPSAIITICILGIIFKNINYFAAILGFIIADEIGKVAGWHK